MGNALSASTSGSSIENSDEQMALMLDLYAQRIILKEVKFNSTLSDSGKCEKLIIITSDVLNRLPFRLISYMDRRHKLFSERYEMFNAMDRTLLVNTNPEILKESKLDEPNEFRKRQMCVGLARFYVQIGNLFNAIMSTMRPYNYENTRRTGPDNFYDILTFSLIDGQNSKDNTRYDTSNMSGFTKKQRDMSRQLDRLLKVGDAVMEISPGAGICSVKREMDQVKITPMVSSGSSSSQNKIKPSIFAMLDELYFDIFHQTSSVNPRSPQFIAMSEDMKNNIYKRDVKQLYRVVTGGKEPGDEIKTFSDVARFINDNDEIEQWCSTNQNRTAKIRVTDDIRYDSTFVKYVKHIKDMMYFVTKQRRSIVALLDRVFVTMKKSEEEMRQIEENWDKDNGRSRRYEGFDVDDEYARKFFRLNLKYDFFINPSLTDADLQVIINEARTRIVRLYADSYNRFYKGFQILQELQQLVEVERAKGAQELAKRAQEQGLGQEKEDSSWRDRDRDRDRINWNSNSFQDEKYVSDQIRSILFTKNGQVAREFGDVLTQLLNKGNSDNQLKNKMWTIMKRMNNEMREYLDRDRVIDKNVEGLVLEKIRNSKNMYEAVIQPPPQPQATTAGRNVFL